MKFLGGNGSTLALADGSLIDIKSVMRGQMYGTQIPGVIEYFNKTLEESITVSDTNNAMAVGPITVNTGCSITIADGSRFVVL